MRRAHSLLLPTLAIALLGASWSAQAADPSAIQASSAVPARQAVFDPAASTLPLQHLPLAASGTIVAQPGDWKAANAAVAEFPRGHADVLKWEKAQTGKVAPASTESPPAHPHSGHGGQP